MLSIITNSDSSNMLYDLNLADNMLKKAMELNNEIK